MATSIPTPKANVNTGTSDLCTNSSPNGADRTTNPLTTPDMPPAIGSDKQNLGRHPDLTVVDC